MFTLIILDAVICFIDAGIMIWVGLMVQAASDTAGLSGLGAALASAFYACGAIIMIFGVMFLILAWGFWSCRPWGYSVTFVLCVLGVVFGGLGIMGSNIASSAISVVMLLLNIVALYFLTRPEIKAYFGKR